jgi:DNA-binding response OmpR family regulator
MKEELGKVLLIGDGVSGYGLVTEAFAKSGFAVDVVPFDQSELREICVSQYNAILVDCEEVAENPVDFLKARRNNGPPVIILSPVEDVINHVLALEIGADDFIVKPCDVRILLARTKLVIRRDRLLHMSEDKVITYDGLVINRMKRTVEIMGQKIDMPAKEFELFYKLASNPNMVFTREELLENIWGFDFSGKSRTIDVHIKRLRNKVERPELPWRVSTVWSIGYKFETKEIMSS